MDSRKSKENRTIILNGTKVWLGAIVFLVIHGGACIWWASRLTTEVKDGFRTTAAQIVAVDNKVDRLADHVEANRKEAKQDVVEARNSRRQ